MSTLTAAPRVPLADVVDPAALAEAVAAGLVRAQRHPRRPLTIYNYTEACVYAGSWNPVTLACRGLIVHEASEPGMPDPGATVLARPLPKFFNHDQPQAPALRPDAPVRVTDKIDGSLGILYPDGEGVAVATRGSFDSAQARHATRLLRERYAGFTPPTGRTVLVEIVFPANRIVVDYAGLDDLVLLGAVEIADGRSHGPEAVPGWPGPTAAALPYATFAESLTAPPRPNREGLVVHCPATDTRVKIKYAEYVRLHRLVTGLNARTVWDVLAAGGDLAALIAPLPDEFHPWVRAVAADLTAAVQSHAAAVEAAYGEIVAGLPEGWNRRDFAARVARHPQARALFLRLDGKDYRPLLWRQVRPAADDTPHTWSAA